MICKALAGNFLAGVLYVSTKSSKIITKKLQKSYCKLVSKELQYGYSKGTSPAECEIFFFLFFGISGTVSPPPAVLLHSRDPCAAQAVSRFVCKKARPFWTSFFASINHAKTGFSCGKVWPYAILVGNLPVFLQRTFTKFGAAGVCIPAGFVVQYIQSIYRLQTWIRLMLMR